MIGYPCCRDSPGYMEMLLKPGTVKDGRKIRMGIMAEGFFFSLFPTSMLISSGSF